jgi:flagellar basal body rod protein FlgG
MGMLKQTGRALDIALDGEGFLAIQTPNGERYTRAGSLTLNVDGQLVTEGSHLVVGENGPITIPPGEVNISVNGIISVKDNFVARLKLVRFDDARASLLKEGNALFVASTPPIPATALRVVQNALEMPNVNTITEMASMIQTSREFDSLQRTATTLMNDLGRKIANEIGRI